MEEFFHQLTNGSPSGASTPSSRLGYTMVYGVLRLINFAHGDLFTLGSYLGLTLLFSLGLQGKMSGILVGGALIVMSMGLVAVVGYLLERWPTGPCAGPTGSPPWCRPSAHPSSFPTPSCWSTARGARCTRTASCLPWRSACLAWTSRSCASSCSWARWC